MEISRELIEFLGTPGLVWRFCRNRSYTARIQRGDPEREYNIPDRPGVVYNFLEDSCAPVFEGCFIVTGALGEQWCIGPGSVGKYGLAPEDIGFEPVEVQTREVPDLYAFIIVPEDTEFSVRTDYGEKVWLRGNRPGIPHGGGDIFLLRALEQNGSRGPDMEDCGRIVNGELFPRIYKEVAP